MPDIEPQPPWDREDDPWMHQQRKRATAADILYPWVREALETSAAWTKHRLGWIGTWGGPAIEVDGEKQTLYSAGKMVEMAMVASQEPEAFETLVEEHTLEELESMSYNMTMIRYAGEDDE